MEGRLVEEGLTFDDVLMIPAHSEVIPSETDLSTSLTASIHLKVPILSAAMDTVTEHAMAIAIAKEGGLGFIHKNMSIAEQASEVRKVKKYEAGVVSDPVAIPPSIQVGEIRKLAAQHGFSSFPVVDPETRKVLGIVTGRDIKYQTDPSIRAQDFMTEGDRLVTVRRSSTRPTTATTGLSLAPTSAPRRLSGSRRDSVPEAVTGDDSRMSATICLSRGEVKGIMVRNRVEKIVVVDEEGRLEGLITHQDFIKAEAEPNACRDFDGCLRVGAAVGCGKDTLDRVAALVDARVDVIVVDSSHGHSEGVLGTVRKVRAAFPSLCIVGGNVCTAEGARDLVEAGADAVKVGIGPGSICTTRVVTGCGYPQLSAIANARKGVEGVFDKPIPIIADGGLRYSGDIAKALAAGAHCVMVGSMLAGTEEAPGVTELFEGRSYKSYRGMGSAAAMAKGSADRYFQGGAKKFVPEGVEGRVPYKGLVKETVSMQLGGVRACMGLTGCRTIDDLHENVKFVRVSTNGVLESHPHNIIMTKEPPNYSRRT